MAFGQLVEHDNGAGGDHEAFAGFADETNEIRVDERRSAIELALEAAFGKALQRQRAAGAGAAVQERIGLGGHDLQHLRVDAGVGAGIALIRDDADAGGPAALLEIL